MLIGERGDDNDETVPDEFDESEATGACGQSLEMLASAILICQSDRCNN